MRAATRIRKIISTSRAIRSTRRSAPAACTSAWAPRGAELRILLEDACALPAHGAGGRAATRRLRLREPADTFPVRLTDRRRRAAFGCCPWVRQVRLRTRRVRRPTTVSRRAPSMQEEDIEVTPPRLRSRLTCALIVSAAALFVVAPAASGHRRPTTWPSATRSPTRQEVQRAIRRRRRKIASR